MRVRQGGEQGNRHDSRPGCHRQRRSRAFASEEGSQEEARNRAAGERPVSFPQECAHCGKRQPAGHSCPCEPCPPLLIRKRIVHFRPSRPQLRMASCHRAEARVLSSWTSGSATARHAVLMPTARPVGRAARTLADLPAVPWAHPGRRRARRRARCAPRSPGHWSAPPARAGRAPCTGAGPRRLPAPPVGPRAVRPATVASVRADSGMTGPEPRGCGARRPPVRTPLTAGRTARAGPGVGYGQSRWWWYCWWT